MEQNSFFFEFDMPKVEIVEDTFEGISDLEKTAPAPAEGNAEISVLPEESEYPLDEEPEADEAEVVSEVSAHALKPSFFERILAPFKTVEVAKKEKKSRKPWLQGLAVVLVFCLCLSAFAGGGRKSESSGDTMVPGGSMVAKPSEDGMAVENFGDSQKLVRRSSAYIQSLDIIADTENLKTLAKSMSGYCESSYWNNGSYYGSSYKSSSFTLRIPVDNYDAFIASLTGDYHVMHLSENVEDISEEYFDVQGRLESLQTKLSRLQQLLLQAEGMQDILLIENEINETQYQIDSYTASMNRYDRLVDYATIEIYLEEVSRLGETGESNFFVKLWQSFVRGIRDFAGNVGEFFYWAAYNAIGFGLLVLAAGLIYRFRWIAKIKKGWKRKDQKKEISLEETEKQPAEEADYLEVTSE